MTKRRETANADRAAPGLDTSSVTLGEMEVKVGLGQAAAGGGTVVGPFAPIAAGSIARLGDDIGNAALGGDDRAEEVGRPVIVVIGEPELGRRASASPLVRPAFQQARCLPSGRQEQGRIGAAKKAARRVDGTDIMAEIAQHGDELTRHAAIPRDAVIVEPVEGRVEGDAQGRTGQR